jgi:hypothetical protein
MKVPLALLLTGMGLIFALIGLTVGLYSQRTNAVACRSLNDRARSFDAKFRNEDLLHSSAVSRGHCLVLTQWPWNVYVFRHELPVESASLTLNRRIKTAKKKTSVKHVLSMVDRSSQGHTIELSAYNDESAAAEHRERLQAIIDGAASARESEYLERVDDLAKPEDQVSLIAAVVFFCVGTGLLSHAVRMLLSNKRQPVLDTVATTKKKRLKTKKDMD